MQFGSSQPRHPVIERAPHQLVGEPERDLRRGDLLDHPVGDRLLHRRCPLLIVQPRPRDRRQTEFRSGHGGELEQPAGPGVEPGQPLADDLAHALRAPELGQGAGQPRPAVVDRHRVALQQRAPQLGHEKGVAPGELAQEPGDLRQIRDPLVIHRARDEVTDLVGGQTGQAQPDHAVRAPQVRERGRQRPRHLRFGVAKRGDHQRARLGGPARQVAEQEQRRRIGPVAILDHDDERSAPAGGRQEVAHSAMQTVARGIRVRGNRKLPLAETLGHVGHEEGQLVGMGAEVGRQRPLVDVAHELGDGLDEGPVGTSHHRVAGAVQHERASGGRALRELVDEPALAGPGLAADEREPESLTVRARNERPQRRQLAGAARERKRRSQAKWSRQLAHASDGVQPPSQI